MEAADHHVDAGLAQRPRDVERAGELVRLHADQADHAEAAVLRHEGDDSVGAHARIGLVHRRDVDGDVGAEHAALRRVGGEAVDGGERVRWNRGAHPLDDVAVGVVMRRLDQHQLETPSGLQSWCKHPHAPTSQSPDVSTKCQYFTGSPGGKG
jgi:hypothetical protein